MIIVSLNIGFATQCQHPLFAFAFISQLAPAHWTRLWAVLLHPNDFFKRTLAKIRFGYPHYRLDIAQAHAFIQSLI
jgi:hypothetical protein